MSTAIEAQAASVAPPQDIYVLASSTSVQTFKLPAKFKASWIRVYADGVTVYVRFGIASPNIDETDTSTESGDEVPVTTDGGVPIAPGTYEDFDLRYLGLDNHHDVDAQRVWMGVKSSATGGYVRWYKSSGPK